MRGDKMFSDEEKLWEFATRIRLTMKEWPKKVLRQKRNCNKRDLELEEASKNKRTGKNIIDNPHEFKNPIQLLKQS